MPSSPSPARSRAPRRAAPPAAEPVAVDTVDTSALERLAGYNIRRASLAIMALFAERMAAFDLKVASFSVLTLIAHNPGITSRQLCAVLAIQPPNLVAIVAALDARGALLRQPHPTDGRAVGLHLTPAGTELAATAGAVAEALEAEATDRLTAAERRTLQRLLQKIYG